jgi:hypothetical protein
MSYFAALTQNVISPPALQSVANIAPGATWPSGYVSTLSVAGIQPNLFADQNCEVYVDQSSDGIVADAGTDSFRVYANTPKGWTVQATSAYVQVRVKNLGSAVTTTLVLATALCPIVESLPRALSEEGNLKVGVYEIEDPNIGKKVLVTPMNALKVTESVRLVGAALFEPLSSHFWTTSTTGSGSVTQGGGQVTLATGVTNASTAALQSVRVARYVGASSNFFRSVARFPVAIGVNFRRIGAFTDGAGSNGCFFEYENGVAFKVVTRKNAIDTAVPSGSFNGNLGVSYTPDTNSHTWEILWTNSTVWFYVDGELLHRVSAPTAPWAITMSMPVRVECNNGANINDNSFEVRSATISRLGHLETQPQHAHINTSTTTVLKSGPGFLHNIIICTEPTADWGITVYDNSAASGSVMGIFTSRGSTTAKAPVGIDLHVPFSIGLTILTAGGTPGDLMIIFE